MSLYHIIRSEIESGAICGTTDVGAGLIRLYESLIAIGTAARCCEYLLDREGADTEDLRAMIRQIVATSDVAIEIVRD